MAPAADRWFLTARALLDTIVDGYMVAGVDLPDRQLVTPGLPAWDCALLAVQMERTFSYQGDLASEVIDPHQASSGFALRGAVFVVHLIRCVPVLDDDGNPPPADQEEAAAELVLTDAERMLDVIVAAVRNGDVGGCRSLGFDAWQNVGPDGGLAGGTLRIRVGA